MSALEKAFTDKFYKTQECTDCGKEYKAKYIILVSKERDTTCGKCDDCRARREEQWEVKRAELEEMTRQAEIIRKRREWREGCGIPPKFMNEDFKSFDTSWLQNEEDVCKICLDYADGFPIEYSKHIKEEKKAYPSLLLLSPNGLGKTHLACSIIHRILDRWQGESVFGLCKFISETEIYQSIQATYSYSFEEKRYRESEDDIIKGLIYRPLLVLDDVGKEPRYDMRFIRRTIFKIINGRYDNLRPIVVTTNLTLDELGSYMGRDGDEASFDRLVEMCKVFHELRGKSYRRQEG